MIHQLSYTDSVDYSLAQKYMSFSGDELQPKFPGINYSNMQVVYLSDVDHEPDYWLVLLLRYRVVWVRIKGGLNCFFFSTA